MWSVAWCGVWCVVVGCVGVVWWCWCVLWCVVVCCVGVVVCILVSFCVFFSFSLSSILSLACSRSFFFSSFFLLSSLLATAANFEAFECDLAHGKCTAVGSLPPPPSSFLSLPSSKKKKREHFYYRNIFGEGIIFYSFILIQKNRRRVKLQILQFYINSKKFKLQRVKSVIIFGRMVLVRSGLVAVDTAVGAIVVSDLSFGAGRPALCLE